MQNAWHECRCRGCTNGAGPGPGGPRRTFGGPGPVAGHGAQGPGPGPGARGLGPGARPRGGGPVRPALASLRVRSCMPCIKCRCRGVYRWRGARAWGTKGATRCIFSITVMGVVPSRCFANQPNLHLTLFGELRTLHLTLFVELRCPTSHQFRRWCAGVHRIGQRRTLFTITFGRQLLFTVILCRQLLRSKIADVVFVHNHIEVGNTWSALILEAAEPRAQPNT